MKKKLLILVGLLLLLVGCKQEKFYLEDNLYENNTITDITVKEFKKLEKDKKNFAIFVYLPGCTSCAEFKEVLTEFNKDNNIEFYSISITECDGTSILDNIKFALSMLLYEKGEVVAFLDATSDEDKPELTDVNSFKTWLNEYIYITK